MTRKLATFITGAVLGGALLAPLSLVAQEEPAPKAEQGCGPGGCCGDDAKAPAAGTPVKADGGCCGDDAKAPAAGTPVKADGGCCGDEAMPINDGPGEGKAADTAKAAPAPGAEQQAMMEAWMALGRPGDAHRKLDVMAGTWTATSKMWHEPGGAPLESTGTATNTWALGGRFLEQRSFATLPCGTAFEGHGYTGFDNATGKYVGLWLDSMSTGALVSTGQADATGKVLTFVGEVKGPGGVTMKYRHQVELTSTDRHVFTLWQAMGDGPEMKIVETVYTRR